VFVSTVGGLRINDPSMIAQLRPRFNLWDRPACERLIAFGETASESRPVPRLELRPKEAARMGYATAIIPLKPSPFRTE
jgi:predicted ATP-dependent serine protease